MIRTYEQDTPRHSSGCFATIGCGIFAFGAGIMAFCVIGLMLKGLFN